MTSAGIPAYRTSPVVSRKVSRWLAIDMRNDLQEESAASAVVGRTGVAVEQIHEHPEPGRPRTRHISPGRSSPSNPSRMVLGLGAKGWILLKKQVPVNFLSCARRGDVCDAPKETEEHKRRAHDLLNDSLYRIGSQVKRELVNAGFMSGGCGGAHVGESPAVAGGHIFFPVSPESSGGQHDIERRT